MSSGSESDDESNNSCCVACVSWFWCLRRGRRLVVVGFGVVLVDVGVRGAVWASHSVGSTLNRCSGRGE